jgi:hypothetical protein
MRSFYNDRGHSFVWCCEGFHDELLSCLKHSVTQQGSQSGFHLLQNYEERIWKLSSFQTALKVPILKRYEMLKAVALKVTFVWNASK